MTHFHGMLKISESLKSIEVQAVEALRSLFDDVPSVDIERIDIEANGDRGIDILARVKAFGRPHLLACEVKMSGQPRYVRSAVLQLQHAMKMAPEDAIPVFIAPFLSLESQALCREEKIGYLDLEGNCRLVFDGVFIERQVPTRPSIERRELKSIFKPKSAQVLRVMLRNPSHSWRVADLAKTADVSLGHVSNVRAALVDRDWASVGNDGLSLTRPDAVLDAWRDAYEPPAGDRQTFYTTLHGNAFNQAAREAIGTSRAEGRAILASFSAAQWQAPYARVGSQFLYADAHGLKRVQEALKLSSAVKGENVIVTILTDEGPLLDAVEPSPGLFCTSPAQTYLDLAAAGDRGREAADHLRNERLRWPQ
jgi:hypothetical protein